MEDFHGGNIPEDTGRNDSGVNYRSGCRSNVIQQYDFVADAECMTHVVTCIITCVGLPLTLAAIRAVYSLLRDDHVAPIYIINLLLSDVLQFCYMIVVVTKTRNWIISEIFSFMYFYGLLTSVGFMVCIALERYLVIAWPLWYRFRRTIKGSVVVSVVVWVLPLVSLPLAYFGFEFEVLIIFGIFLLLPLPLLVFFLVGTLKALSAAISVPSEEKRRIVAVLVTVLLIYVVLFLPGIILLLTQKGRYRTESDRTFIYLSVAFLKLSPLADLFLYVFTRKGAVDKLLASLCCCRMDSNDTNRPAVMMSMSMSTTCTHA